MLAYMGGVGQDFIFIVGVQRSGTSFLSDVLAQQNQVTRTRQTSPEPRIFWNETPTHEFIVDRHFGRTIDQTLDSVLLEKSTSYFGRPHIAHRILSRYPHAKCLVVLRDPIERALSHYRFTLRNGLEYLPPSVAFRLDYLGLKRPKPRHLSTNPYSYLRSSLYFPRLSAWSKKWPANQFFIAHYEEITGSEDYLRELALSLGLNATRRSIRTAIANANQNSTPKFPNSSEERSIRQHYARFFRRDTLKCGRLEQSLARQTR